MRNLKLVDAVIQLHDIARVVEAEIGNESISNEIRQTADRLHLYSIDDDKANTVTKSIINQAKE
jgi:signal transduction histidine kinase